MDDDELDDTTLVARLNAAAKAKDKEGETLERLALDKAMINYLEQVGPDNFLNYLCYRVIGIERIKDTD